MNESVGKPQISVRTFADDLATAKAATPAAEPTKPAVGKAATPTAETTEPTESAEPAAASTKPPEDTYVDVDIPEADTVPRDAHVQDIDDAVAGGEIVREKKRKRFRLFPALGRAFSGWAKDKVEDITEDKRPSVTDPSTRSDTVQHATEHGALPQSDDHTTLAEHIRNQPMRDAGETVSITNTEDLPTPQWSSSLSAATDEPEPKPTPAPTDEPTPTIDPETTFIPKTVTESAATSEFASDTAPAVATPETEQWATVDEETQPTPASVIPETEQPESVHEAMQTELEPVTETPQPMTTPESVTEPPPEPPAAPNSPEPAVNEKPEPDIDTAAPAPTSSVAAAVNAEPVREPEPDPEPEPPADEPFKTTTANRWAAAETDSTPVPTAEPDPTPTPTPVVDTPETAQTKDTNNNPTYQYRPTPTASERNWRTYVVYIAVAVAAVALGITLSIYAYQYLVQPDRMLAPEVSSAIRVDDSVPVSLGVSRTTVLQTIANTLAGADGRVVQVYPIIAADDGTTRPATAQDFLTIVPIQASGSFQRNITNVTFFGTGENSTGVIITFTDLDTALGGMFAWERNMVSDLAPILGTSPITQFTDTTSNNRDIRIAERADGTELLYTFINRTTLLITTDRALISETVNRLR